MKKKDIFLILAPLFYTKLPPLSLAYLSEFLEQKGIGVCCHDLNIQWYRTADAADRKEWAKQNNAVFQQKITREWINYDNPIIIELMKKIDHEEPKIIGFSLFKNNYYPTFKIAALIRSRHPDIPFIFGGPEAQHIERKEDKKYADHIIIGEGECALFDLLQQKGLKAIKRKQEDAELIDINKVPWPRFRGLDRRCYDNHTALPLLMSRGCIRQCAFCSERFLYTKYRCRDPRLLVEEIQHHTQQNGITHFVFHDSLINGDLARLRAFCELLIEKEPAISWEAQCCIRPDMVPELFLRMKKSGCVNLFIGLEAASDPVLRRMNKGFTREEARMFFERLTAAGLHFEISLITHFPGETKKEFEETCAFIKENKHIIPKIAQINPFIPYRGTPAAAMFCTADEKSGLEKMNALVSLCMEEKIPFTRGYIGNLL